MTNYKESLAFKLEKHLTPFEQWTDEMISNFPQDVQDELNYIIRWSRGEEKHMPHPTGIGHHPEYGWFCIGAGQGPFIIWVENEK